MARERYPFQEWSQDGGGAWGRGCWVGRLNLDEVASILSAGGHLLVLREIGHPYDAGDVLCPEDL